MQLLDPTQPLFKPKLHPKFLPKQNNYTSTHDIGGKG